MQVTKMILIFMAGKEAATMNIGACAHHAVKNNKCF